MEKNIYTLEKNGKIEALVAPLCAAILSTTVALF